MLANWIFCVSTPLIFVVQAWIIWHDSNTYWICIIITGTEKYSATCLYRPPRSNFGNLFSLTYFEWISRNTKLCGLSFTIKLTSLFCPFFFPYQCFFPQNLVANIQTPLFILNTAYDSWQVILLFNRFLFWSILQHIIYKLSCIMSNNGMPWVTK